MKTYLKLFVAVVAFSCVTANAAFTKEQKVAAIKAVTDAVATGDEDKVKAAMSEQVAAFPELAGDIASEALKLPEITPSIIAFLGSHVQKTGLAFKNQADLLRENADDASKAEVIRLDQLSHRELLSAAMVFETLAGRFPESPLAGIAGLRAGQNYMRIHEYNKAINIFTIVHANDDGEVRSQSSYWSGICHEQLAALLPIGNDRDKAMGLASESYRSVIIDSPESAWAKYARGRLADPAFEERDGEGN